MNFVTIFLLRRLSLVMAIFFCVDDLAVFQTLYNVLFSLFYILYLVSYKPFETKLMQNTELLTEFCFLFFGYGLMHFNPIVDAEMMFDIGWYCIVIVSINLSVNLALVVVTSLIDLKNNGKKATIWCKRKCCTPKEPKEKTNSSAE